MELHPFDGKAAMAKSHDDAGAIFLEGMGGDLEVSGQVVFGDDEGVVASRGHRRRNAPEDRLTVVFNLTGLAVHEVLRAYDASAEGSANGLMSQTYAKERHFPGKIPDEVNADASLLRCAWARGNDNAIRVQPLDSVNSDLIVASNLDLRTELAQVLDEVVRKRVVVIEHEDHKDHFDTGEMVAGSCLLCARFLLFDLIRLAGRISPNA